MTEPTAAPKTNSALARWKRKGQAQEITLHSGEKVKIKIPDVPEMLRAGEVPNELIAAVQEARDDTSAGGFDLDKVKEATDYMRWLVSVTVTDPVLTPEDVPELPVLDRDMILEFALRQRDRDSVGHQLYGMEKVSEWKSFRERRPLD